MSSSLKERRQFVKTGLALPLLAAAPWGSLVAKTSGHEYRLPENVMQAVQKLYGDRVFSMVRSSRFKLKVADEVDNDNTPVGVIGDKSRVLSLAVFSPYNKNPLANYCKFYGKSDLSVYFRIKLKREGEIYLVVETPDGLQYDRSTKVRFERPCKGG